MRKSFSGDRIFFLIIVILVVAGIAAFASASLGLLAREDGSPGRLAFTQLVLGLVPGVIALLVLRFTPQKMIAGFAPLFYIFSVGLTALVFVPGIGETLNGATRWIDLGFTTIQPGEFLKIGVVLMLAFVLARGKGKLDEFSKGLLPFAFVVGLPLLLLIMQPNTSTAIVIALTAGAMYVLAGAPVRDILILVLGAVLVAAVLLGTRPYLVDRVTTFFNPSHDALGTSYQIQQSLIAIGSGGVAGRGFGQSAQKFNYLPEPQGDSIFAVVGEEFGFIGATFLVLLFTAFASRGLSIAAEASTMFGSLAAAGLTLIIAISAFLNIGAMLGILPLTGLPLPFISHGGTALLAALASVGIILNVAAHRKTR